MGFLANKKILITGIASNKSIAYGIAKAMYREGAKLAFTYPNNKIKTRIEIMSEQFNSNIILPCDVSDDNNIIRLFQQLSNIWPKFDGFVHSIAYAPTDQLHGDYIENINKEAFTITHNISSYSFVAMAKTCRKMLNNNASIVTLTYLGAVRVIPNYNIMGVAKASLEANTRYMAYTLGKDGIRVNAISPGPIRTVSSSSIANFKNMLSYCKKNSPIKRNVSIEEIGNTAAFLCSNLSSGITGEIIYVDGGFNITQIDR